MDQLEFHEWIQMYHELMDQIMYENWKRDGSKGTFEEYKEEVKKISSTGMDKKEYERIQRLASL